jgi:hypothetical protein
MPALAKIILVMAGLSQLFVEENNKVHVLLGRLHGITQQKVINLLQVACWSRQFQAYGLSLLLDQ